MPLALVLLAGALYAIGLRRLRIGPAWPSGRTASFLGGLAAVLVALASPVDRYATALFSVHMVQHLLLTFVAAPLLALGAPITLALRATGPRGRRTILRTLRWGPIRLLTHPLVAFALFTVTLFVTHLTGLYDAALESWVVHNVEHVLFLGSGLLFWWPVVGLDPAPGRPSHPVRVGMLAAAMPMESILAIALLGSDPYPHYRTLPLPFGGAAAEGDHGTAVAIMWGGAELAVVIGALLVAAAWFRHEQVKQRRIEEAQDRAAGEAPGTLGTPLPS